jgi:hypothetical protein
VVAIWATSGAHTLSTDGVLTLSDGRTFTLDDIPGNGFNANRLRKINAAAQELIDHRVPISSLPPEDPDRIFGELGDDAWFEIEYEGRMFISDDGLDIISRSTLVEIINTDGELSIQFSNVR